MQDKNSSGNIENMIKKIAADPHNVDQIDELIWYLEKEQKKPTGEDNIGNIGDVLQGFLGLLYVIKFLIRYQHQTQDKIDELTVSLNSYGKYIERLEKRINEFEMKSLR